MRLPIIMRIRLGRILGPRLALPGSGYFCIDEMRRSTEQIPPVQYLALTYYEKWLESLISAHPFMDGH